MKKVERGKNLKAEESMRWNIKGSNNGTLLFLKLPCRVQWTPDNIPMTVKEKSDLGWTSDEFLASSTLEDLRFWKVTFHMNVHIQYLVLLLYQDSPLEPWKWNQVTTTCHFIGSYTKESRLLRVKTEFLNFLCDSLGCLSEMENHPAEIFQVILSGSKYFQIIAQLHSGCLLCGPGSELIIGTFQDRMATTTNYYFYLS